MVFTLMRVSVRSAAVTAHPDLHGLPGSNVLQQLVNGAEAWSLAIALLGAFVGAGLWAVASHTHNPHYAARGRMAALVSPSVTTMEPSTIFSMRSHMRGNMLCPPAPSTKEDCQAS